MRTEAERATIEALPLGRLRVVALHGPTANAVRDAGRAVVGAALGSEGDALRLTLIEGCDLARVDEAVRSRPLGGGRAVVWVPEASEKVARLVGALLAEAEAALLVLGFGERFGASALGATIASSDHGCLIDCSSSRASRERRFHAVLSSLLVTIDRNAMAALIDWAEASGQPGETVAAASGLLAGRGGHVGMETVEFIGAAPDGAAVIRGVSAGLEGDGAALDRAVRTALDDGQAGIGLLRQAVAAVHLARGRRRDGAGAARLTEVAAALWEAERSAKRTGMPQDVIAAHAVCGLTGRASR